MEKESAGPNSTSAASAGLYKPREENPIPSSAAASGAWVNQAAQELAALRGEAGQKQAEVSDLAAAHYFRKNREQFARLETDAYSKVNYATAKELAADLDTLDKALNNPTSYNGQDTRFKSDGEAVLRKYGATDLQRLRDTLAMRKEELVEALADRGYDFETMAGYDRMLVQQENYLRMQEEWSKEAEEHPVWASGLSVLLAPLRSVDALKAWGNGIGHSNADNLDSYIPFNVYEMQATNMVQTVRKTVSDEIKNIFDWELFGQNVAVFLYNTGMNIADSTFQKVAFGDKATIVLMGCSSAAETTKRVIERGGSNEQAFWIGLSAGAAEVAIESFSVDNLPKLKDAETWGKALKAGAARVGLPIGQGMLTKLSNILADTAGMGNRSEWATAAKNYEELGLSPNDAWLRATLDKLVQMCEAGLEKFISSGLE